MLLALQKRLGKHRCRLLAWLAPRQTYALVTDSTDLHGLPDSKTGDKYIIINKPTLAFLRTIPRVKNNPYVIVGNNKGGRLSTLQHTWEDLRKNAGITDVRLHDLRHSYASLAAGKGASLPIIGNLLGHKHPQTTARYIHIAASPADAPAEAVGQIISEIWHPGARLPSALLRPVVRRTLGNFLAKHRRRFGRHRLAVE